jgi:thiol-disulfide isomerase/thioredoxin
LQICALVIISIMGKRLITCVLFMCITFAVKAEGYRISVNWVGLKDTSVFLGNYYDTKIYVDDTIKLDQNGKGVFTGTKSLHEGLYVLYLGEKAFIDILIGADQDFDVQTDTAQIYQNLKITGATESENFLKYQNFLRAESFEKNSLEKELQNADAAKKTILQDKIDAIDNKVTNFISVESQKNKGTMYSVFLTTSERVFLPELTIDKKTPKYDSIAWFHYYNFNRDHFFDNIDFSDDRILFTPLMQPKLDTYFNKILIQTPDSVTPQALKLIKRSKVNKLVFQYISQFLINNSLQSKIMGMDAVFVSVADNVYLNGEATWADTTTLKKVAEQAYLIRPNIIGKISPELVMENMEGEFESLHQLQSDYTVLVFWEPTCGHCKKEIPDLYEKVYSNYLKYNIEYFAVNMGDKKNEWTDFVNSHQLVGWHHLWDPTNQSRFRYKYNVQTTPMIYLLDKDKKIIAKKIDNPSLVKLLDSLLKK